MEIYISEYKIYVSFESDCIIQKTDICISDEHHDLKCKINVLSLPLGLMMIIDNKIDRYSAEVEFIKNIITKNNTETTNELENTLKISERMYKLKQYING